MTTLLIIVSITFFVTTIIFLIRGINLVKQNEQLIDLLQQYEERELQHLQDVESTLQTMREIDIRGSFESDDEVGSVFQQLKTIIETYNNNIQ